MGISQTDKEKVLEECHLSDLPSHPGIVNTRLRLQARYYWVGLEQDVDSWVSFKISKRLATAMCSILR